MLSDTAILRKIERQPRNTAGYKLLVRELGVRGNDRRELSDRLARLVGRGELVQVVRDRYAIPQASHGKNVVLGRLSMHRDGYGFVIPESTEVAQRITGDIYVNPSAIGSAMHGDRVMVQIGAVRSDGRAEGRILRILGRAHPTVVGIFHYGSRYNFVTPIDEKITQDVMIPLGMETPPAVADEQETHAPTAAPELRKGSQHRVLGK